jgi:hypothetical protein
MTFSARAQDTAAPAADSAAGAGATIK